MIVYQGVEGAYSHLACQHVFPQRQARACETFLEAMQAVEQGEANLAMIPVENSTAGRVEEIYRLIPKMSLHIVGEHFEPVNHCLLALPQASLASIRSVGSHPQALAQCNNHIAQLGLVEVAKLDTAGAACEVSQSGDTTKAAIASSLAAELYGLKILRDNFQDEQGNTTRFIILSHTEQLPVFEQHKSYITSIIFRVRNIPAALYKTLGGFATNGVNLVKLESYMPGGRLNASQFHVDIEGHLNMRSMELAIEELSFFAEEVRVLGSYEAHPFRASANFHE
ncbi:prephenate dehydratase [Alkalimarinus coralli]|uniref:prephenate dehydratase n=1 Tax=Alkalimarinus coralli TaxID=2935863 RepID=UPI00202B4EA4|nr:prephenate dehydratase [Alkalimarinus coralli]